MKNNILIGRDAGKNITTAKNCICLGINSGPDIIDQNDQVRIGENTGLKEDNMVIFGEGRVIISKEVFNFLFDTKI